MKKKLLMLDVAGFGSLVAGAIFLRYFQVIIGIILIPLAVGLLLWARRVSKEDSKVKK